MSEESVNRLELQALEARESVPEVSSPHAGSAGGTERRRSRSGVEPVDPAVPSMEAVESGEVGVNDEWNGADRAVADLAGVEAAEPSLPPLARGRQRSKALSKPVGKEEALRPEQRLLLLDTWLRSGLPAGDFAAMVGV